MTKKNALNGIFLTVIIMLAVFASGLRTAAADESWSWNADGVTITATAIRYPGQYTVSWRAENNNDYKIKIGRFAATVKVGGKSYTGNIGGYTLEPHKGSWIGDIYADYEGSQRVTSVSIAGQIEVERR